MMDKYINAKELKQKINEHWSYESNSYADGIDNMIRFTESIIDEMPSADVVEVKHGKWIVDKEPTLYDNIYYGMYKQFSCSVCNSQFKEGFNFCPNCGADMRGEKE